MRVENVAEPCCLTTFHGTASGTVLERTLVETIALEAEAVGVGFQRACVGYVEDFVVFETNLREKNLQHLLATCPLEHRALRTCHRHLYCGSVHWNPSIRVVPTSRVGYHCKFKPQHFCRLSFGGESFLRRLF